MPRRSELKKKLEKDKKAKLKIDIHAHAGFDHYSIIKRRYPTSQSIKDLALKMKLGKIDLAATFPCPNSTYYFDLRSIPTKEQILKPLPTENFPYEFSNRQLLYETSLFGENKIMPFAIIFPGYEEEKQLQSLESYAKEDLLFGLKHHTLVGGISAKKLINSKFMKFAEKYSLPIIIHSGIDKHSRPENILELATNHPNIRFCIAHAGEFETSVYEKFAKGSHSNVFFDCSPFMSICYMAKLDLKRDKSAKKLQLKYEEPHYALEQLYKLIPNSLLWGTDEPWTTITDNKTGEILLKVDYQDEVDLLNQLPLPIRNKISHKNNLKFLFGN